MSFRLRMIIIFSIIIALAFGIGGTILISSSFGSSLDEVTESSLDSFETALNTLAFLNSFGTQTDYGDLSEAIEQMEQRGVGHWQAIELSSSTETLYISGNKTIKGYDLPELKDDKCTYEYVNDAYGNGIIVASTLSAGEEVLVLKARFDSSEVYAARDKQQILFRTIYIIVVGLGVFTALALSFAMTGRLRKLTSAVRKIAGGNLDTRSKLGSNDEFGQLSRDIDAMADKLQSNIIRLETDMELRENFMGAFAHELKTPMVSIIGFADMLRQDSLDDNTRLLAANYIFSEGKRLDKLSFKLLDLLLLKKDAIELKTVNINTFIQEIEKILSPSLKKKNIILKCKSERGKASFDPDLVKSLIYNLVDNAAKSIEDGGVIAIRGSIINGGCVFEVVDNGCGMEAEELSKITEAFYRVDKSRSRKQGGAGLGLSLCKEIAELHHGSIGFMSEKGLGTKVTVTLYGRENSNE